MKLSRSDAEDFLIREAALLDSWKLMEWADLFTEDGEYLVPATDDPEASRPWFARLRALAESHGLSELSMGTSQDYRVAAEEGATFVRVGAVLWRE